MTTSVTSESRSSTSTVIEVKNLVKNYGSFEAVKGISFSIERGEIFGLIGPDGAGKTSTFHVLGGVMDATSGDINVLGQTPRLARKSIGYLTQQFSLHLDLSIEENLVYSSGVREVTKEQFNERSKKYLQLMDLYKFKTRLAGQLSGGMKQKLALCCALVSAPDILLLDEPTTGVDPVSRREFWDVLAEVSAEGVTTAVATPYLDEAERCNRVALINEGVIKQIGTPRDLIANLDMHRLEVHSKSLAELEVALAESSNRSKLITDVQEFGDRLDILTPDVDNGKRFILDLAQQGGISDTTISVSEPSLENVFVSTLRSGPGAHSSEAEYKFHKRSNAETQKGKVAIGATNIGIRFGNFKAVQSVSLKVGYGEIFGLLGANGAGKTTTIKMLCGLLTPSQGEMVLAGAKSDLRSSSLRKRIGYMSQKFTLYDDLSVKENLDFYCGVYEVPDSQRREKIDWALSSCGLKGQESLLTGSLPGGWKQRLSFAASIMHQPEILFLDEPTSGVDPLARRQLWRYIRQLARNGTAILVTTHFLEEAEHCQNLAFMVAGEIVAQGSPTVIKNEQPGKLVEIVVDKTQEAARVIREKVAAWKVAIFADALHVALDEPEKELPDILELLKSSGIHVIRHRDIGYSLEDAFIGIVQRASEQKK